MTCAFPDSNKLPLGPIITLNPAGETNSSSVSLAECPAGQVASGGGYDVLQQDASYSVFWNSPDNQFGDQLQWRVAIRNTGTIPLQFYAMAVCINAQ